MTYPKNFESKIGFNDIRKLLSERCLSTLGQEKVSEIAFSSDASLINRQMQEIHEFRTIQESGDDFPLQYFFDLRESVARIRLEGTHLDENEIYDLRRSLDTIGQIVRYLNRTSGGEPQPDAEDTEYLYPTLQSLTKDVGTFPSILHEIDLILDKYGKIRDNASPELLRIRRELQKAEGSVSRTLSAERWSVGKRRHTHHTRRPSCHPRISFDETQNPRHRPR